MIFPFRRLFSVITCLAIAMSQSTCTASVQSSLEAVIAQQAVQQQSRELDLEDIVANLKLTDAPTKSPKPSPRPTKLPSPSPTESPAPSPSPSETPSSKPTVSPAPSALEPNPTGSPTESPAPSPSPSETPTFLPTSSPSSNPTIAPTISQRPSSSPSITPSEEPTAAPTLTASVHPTNSPAPTTSPTQKPSHGPTDQPTETPSVPPTISSHPTMVPTKIPSASPSGSPSSIPSDTPSLTPSLQPTKTPSISPTASPSRFPTSPPTNAPSQNPSASPSSKPSSSPSSAPTVAATRTKTASITLTFAGFVAELGEDAEQEFEVQTFDFLHDLASATKEYDLEILAVTVLRQNIIAASEGQATNNSTTGSEQQNPSNRRSLAEASSTSSSLEVKFRVVGEVSNGAVPRSFKFEHYISNTIDLHWSDYLQLLSGSDEAFEHLYEQDKVAREEGDQDEGGIVSSHTLKIVLALTCSLFAILSACVASYYAIRKSRQSQRHKELSWQPFNQITKSESSSDASFPGRFDESIDAPPQPAPPLQLEIENGFSPSNARLSFHDDGVETHDSSVSPDVANVVSMERRHNRNNHFNDINNTNTRNLTNSTTSTIKKWMTPKFGKKTSLFAAENADDPPDLHSPLSQNMHTCAIDPDARFATHADIENNNSKDSIDYRDDPESTQFKKSTPRRTFANTPLASVVSSTASSFFGMFSKKQQSEDDHEEKETIKPNVSMQMDNWKQPVADAEYSQQSAIPSHLNKDTIGSEVGSGYWNRQKEAAERSAKPFSRTHPNRQSMKVLRVNTYSQDAASEHRSDFEQREYEQYGDNQGRQGSDEGFRVGEQQDYRFDSKPQYSPVEPNNWHNALVDTQTDVPDDPWRDNDTRDLVAEDENDEYTAQQYALTNPAWEMAEAERNLGHRQLDELNALDALDVLDTPVSMFGNESEFSGGLNPPSSVVGSRQPSPFHNYEPNQKRSDYRHPAYARHPSPRHDNDAEQNNGAAFSLGARPMGEKEKMYYHDRDDDEDFVLEEQATIYDVFAPSGPIGIVVDTTKNGPAVHSVKNTSPILGLIHQGDLIVALDGEDTRGMTAATLTRMMAKKSRQSERRISLVTVEPS